MIWYWVNLYHMYLFRLILQAKSFVLFYLWYSSCFEVKCWIHTFPKRCSHIAMLILILLDHRGRHVNSFSTSVLLFKWFRSFSTSARSTLSFLTGVCFIHPKLSLFFLPSHPFLQGLRFLNRVSILLMGSLSVLFRQCFYLVILKKILTELQVHHSSFSYSSPVD